MSSSDEDNGSLESIVVIDNGSNSMKVGFGGEDTPFVQIPSMVGRPKFRNPLVECSPEENIFIGNAAQYKWGLLNCNRPIERGSITHWEDMEKLWKHIFFQEVRVEPEECKVLLTDKTGDPTERRKMVEIMFETFKVSGMYIALQSVLSLRSSGINSGVVVDSEWETTTITPIYDHKVVTESAKRLEFGGKHITDYFGNLLVEHGYSFFTDSGRNILNDIKEKLCQVSVNQADTLSEFSTKSEDYELPGGKTVTFNGEHLQALEVLFDLRTIQIDECPVEHRRSALYNNIILSGGNTLFEGINERLREEMRQLIPPSVVINVLSPPERKFSPWIGGSLTAAFLDENEWITSAKYEEYGDAIIERM